MSDLPERLLRLIIEESAGPRPPAMVAVAEAARRRHGTAIIAVLLYGSCLREQGFAGRIVDLYLLADRYTKLHHRLIPRALNRLLPPNVYYIEEVFEGGRVARCILTSGPGSPNQRSSCGPQMTRYDGGSSRPWA